tara:strand:+ start:215 stop:514 length:300 start_codon:yes stop_codon:yes gene_type:complete
MAETITNFTNPGKSPVNGDLIERAGNNYSIRTQFYVAGPPTAENIESAARDWRNAEIESTDFVVPLTDHPQHSAYITYRAALRDWPSTSDFPDTKPTLS